MTMKKFFTLLVAVVCFAACSQVSCEDFVEPGTRTRWDSSPKTIFMITYSSPFIDPNDRHPSGIHTVAQYGVMYDVEAATHNFVAQYIPNDIPREPNNEYIYYECVVFYGKARLIIFDERDFTHLAPELERMVNGAISTANGECRCNSVYYDTGWGALGE